ncbi:family 20 glycosylhydrolase [Pseudochryseolinea flava]|uniref:beta-N-acetylhexosaminidase n=1 Tax=Pseudochryseolinea flava TaxID=2059302 RepID=A0A364Y439_9BACT|nr:family 20 glycosylhydrolase [Pseudochryseolinea flava]RAW01627.1 beta-N-acetylhexosaminidase [Pseudochryseolinea flava]
MIKTIFTIIMLMISSVTFSQQLPDVSKLYIEWEVVENNHQNETATLSAFTITNKGKQIFPSSGWSMYFNFIRDIKSSTGSVRVERLNGDLFRVFPLKNFEGIKPGASLRIEFVSGDWVVNFTDAPAGLYFIFDAAPTKGYSISHYTVKPSTTPKQYLRFAADKIGLITPEMLYEQNRIITTLPEKDIVKIFPAPLQYQVLTGSVELNAHVEIVSDQTFSNEASYLAETLFGILGKKPVVVPTATSGKMKIQFVKSDFPEEAYELNINDTGVTITASSGHGIFNGVQSFLSLMPPSTWASIKSEVVVPFVSVKDEPRFPHRAFMLDVSRNFQTKQQILRLLDLMAMYKLNVFHFHLTEDEGWRLEIPSLPELTEVGSKRGHTLDSKQFLPPSFGSGPNVTTPYGSGYYTRADFIEILRYATKRHITVITEIETPGHARAAVKSMDARYECLMKEGKKAEAEKYLLRDLQDASEYRSVQGWTDNVINVAVPSVYTFLETVVDDVLAMYKEAQAPINTIHFGGDEVPAGVWEKSPAVEQLMKVNHNIKSTDDLWYYYYGKVNDIAKKRGLTLYGWEEIAMRKTMLDGNKAYIPNPDFVREGLQVDVWNNVLGWGAEDLAYQLANAGYKVVLSCVSNLYFDMAYHKSFEEPGYYWGAFTDLDKPYYFIPYDYFKNSKEDKLGNALDRKIFIGKERLTDYGKKNIVGIQGLLWSETVQGPDRMEYMILPKMLSLAARAWEKDPAWAQEKDEKKSEAMYQEAWSSYLNVVGQRELVRLDNFRGGYHYRIPSPGAIVANGKVLANIQLPGLTIRYTTDGSEPTPKSKVYTGPLAAKGNVTLKAFNTKGRSGRSSTISNP